MAIIEIVVEVLEPEHSLIFDQAENRTPTTKAVITSTLGD